MVEEPPASDTMPKYSKQQHDKGNLWFIICDEGWRTYIVCDNMYQRHADQLLHILGRQPFSLEEV
jgi:hypothetical protein